MIRVTDIRRFFRKPFFCDRRTLLGLWLLVPLAAALAKMTKHHNNFLIFRGVFHHTLQQTSLYAPYPAEYLDTNHYGPVFSIIIAPFAAISEWMGLWLWLTALSLFLYMAIRQMPVRDGVQTATLWFCSHELLTALLMAQFNIATAAGILLTFVCLQREQDFWAAFWLVLGTFVKLYGIVGLAFFLFSRHKGRFIFSLLFWGVVMFVAPMLISSPEYIISQYCEWYQSLTAKNAENIFAVGQNISLLGMVRKISGCAAYSDLWFIVLGLLLQALPFLRWKQFMHLSFRLAILASVLMFTVLFSTGSESSSYIIALVGVALWYWGAPWERSWWDVALLVFAFVLTSMSPSDLFPAFIRRTWVIPYALKALPISFIWFRLIWELLRREYNDLTII